MKITKQVLLVTLIVFTCCHIGFTQRDKRKYTHLYLYAFDKSYMSITNEYLSEPVLKVSPSYIHYPYNTRKIDIYGPTLGFTITANANSSDFLNRAGEGIISVSGHVMDSIFKPWIDKSVQGKEFRLKPYTDYLPDSIAKNNNRFELSSLQVRVTKNNQLLSDWKNILQLPNMESTKDRSLSKRTFIIFNDSMSVNDHVVISFRNKKDTALIRFEFERKDSPLFPFLASFGRDTTETPYIDYVKKTLERKITNKETTNEFYRNWPAQVGREDIMAYGIKKDRIYANTKLSFTFRKPDPEYVDTSLQYLLAAGRIKDSVWQTTGHNLFLSNFVPGSDYTLLIRYKSTPGNIHTYTFHTLPAWYQTRKYKYIIGASILLALLVLLLLVYRIRLKQEKKENERLNYGLKSIRSQLNPHFIFNALSSIQGLINKNDIPGANHYLTEFSSLLRESLRNNDKELVPLNSELKILETYLKLEQLRFQFQYEIIVDESIDKNAIEIPALLLQPLIENAIKHGVAGLQEKGKVTIAFNATNKNLLVSIADNGNGFIQDNNAIQGLGLKLTKDRIRLLNQSFKKQPIQLYIESSHNTGTTVHLGFENWL